MPARRRVSEPKQTRRKPATTPEGRENQLIAMASDLAEKRMREGTASAQEIVHFLKLGSTREQLEQARLEGENLLLKAKVDAITSASRMEELVAEALKPAKIKNVTLNEAKHSILIKVDEDQLSLAIGKRGQNARLTSRLTGWDINIEKDESAKEVFDSKKVSAAQSFAGALKITEEAANKLVNAGMNSIEVVATGCEPQDIADLLGVDLEAATNIQNAARQEYEKSMASTQ